MSNQDWQAEVQGILSTAAGSNAEVFFAYPSNWTPGKLQIAYRQALAVTGKWADDDPYTEDLTVHVDIWGADPVPIHTAAKAIRAAMLAAGFNREFSQDLYETVSNRHHRAERYRRVE